MTLPIWASADGFTVQNASTRLKNNVYLLDATVDLSFSEEPLLALENGVPLTIGFDIEVVRVRNWWLNDDVAALEQLYRLQYHALSGLYVVENLNSGALYAYPGLGSALASFSYIDGLPLLDANLIEEGEEYQVDIRVKLDVEALPSPLRPVAYVTPGWRRLTSDWFECSLKP